MTRTETLAYNRGVLDVLAIAERAARGIGATTRRPIPESFATAALGELAEAGRALLLPVDADPCTKPESPR